MADSGSDGGYDADVIVIGSGFGGSVSALRLAEKGHRVLVLEAGRRFTPDTLPKNSWHVRRYLWMPRLGCHGIQKITWLGRVVVLSGTAVGGGSVVYANTLYRPLDAFYTDPQWRDITDWRRELEPFFDQAERMLGVNPNPTTTYSDEVFRTVAEEMRVGSTFAAAPVGVFFGRDGSREPGVRVPDPYFGGAGPARTGCVECGECMSGCRRGAKNTLDCNYLYLAERAGVRVVPDTTVTAVRPRSTGGYELDMVRTGGLVRRRRRTLTAEQVVFAAGTLGTQRLLLAMKQSGDLPALSDRLGHLTRTNSEAILGASRLRPDQRIARGVAITSSFHPDEHTHIEPVRYGRGSNLMALISASMTDGGGRVPRWLKYLRQVVLHPHQALASSLPWRWSERTIIALVMQSWDNSLIVSLRRGPFGLGWLTSRQGHGEPNPSWIPEGNDAARRIAARMGGYPGGSIGEIANIPLTAHILGGAPIGTDPTTGVIDPYHRVFGYEGLHVVDGAAVSANLGANPSLTITAQAERAMSFWPNKGEPDPRPPLGAAYRPVAPRAPAHPAVPAGAPGTYRVVGPVGPVGPVAGTR
ncbi:choline dehydrogenase-like flavoprotein [Frankia casuarinae]|uniref:Cholesterol oxidase n=2 Tax=Frankia TaxID=1854 RepID=Q2J4K0_FRACC|nr:MULTISPECIES: GMC family oxidoreductase [Frankia]ABD13792.1 glucose-methanol-choline oxidoreductase [Frankia casuarinae]ETA04061.1 choline dehydrogenase-like flavoprotein [Frankia sp. CcI6]EYT90388.1 choline dehydrogenase-like flavoprotein [Frankia casuarinae]KDA44172.1 choline dehydrogenase-like flavoprotein [Frankia sp. BMG5.23]OAA30808.1 cholesterol oxidase [Frankia casuarinae]